MSELNEEKAQAEPDSVSKIFARPNGSPENLADLVSGLSHQQQAEITYELVLFAALAAEETGHPALNEFLAELEDLASVYTDPERSRALRKSIREALCKPSVDEPQLVGI